MRFTGFREMACVAYLGEFLSLLPLRLDTLGIFLLAIADSSFLTIPEGNDVLIVILSSGKPWQNMIYYVFVTVAGSVIGCLLLFGLGRRGGRPLLVKRFPAAKVERAERVFARFGAWAVFVPSVLPPPCPFKIFVFTAGVFGLDATKFAAAVFVGRTLRYSMWGILAVLYGSPVLTFIHQNLPRIGLALLILFLLVLTGYVVRFIARTWRSDSKTDA